MGGRRRVLQLPHPEAALRFDVQDGEDGLIQHGVADGLGAVGVGGHLNNPKSRLRIGIIGSPSPLCVHVDAGPELGGRSWCRWLLRGCGRGSSAASGSAPVPPECYRLG